MYFVVTRQLSINNRWQVAELSEIESFSDGVLFVGKDAKSNATAYAEFRNDLSDTPLSARRPRRRARAKLHRDLESGNSSD